MFQVSSSSATYAKCIRTRPRLFKMERHAAALASRCFCCTALCMRNTDWRTRRYHPGKWVTSYSHTHTHTVRYINITGGLPYNREGGCIRSHARPLFPPCMIIQQEAQKKCIHATETRQNGKLQMKVKQQMCNEPSEQDAVEKAKR